MPTSEFDRAAPPSLRGELFLIAHDSVTGQPHLGKKYLEIGLAIAILLELWLGDLVAIGWRYDARNGPWHPEPGRITILADRPTGDPILDSALSLLSRMGTPRIYDFIRAYSQTEGLYERVRGDMTAIGMLGIAIRRRFFRRYEIYTAIDPEYPVRARAKVRNLITNPALVTRRPGEPAQYLPALAALVTALGLTRNLNPPEILARTLHTKLNDLIDRLPDPTIRDVTTAVFLSRKRRAASAA